VIGGSAPPLDRGRPLGRLAWVRVALGAFVVGTAAFLPAPLLPERNAALLALALLAVGASSAAVLFLPAPRRGPAAWLLCGLDTVLVTAVVAATGGPRSLYVFLYVLGVIAACQLLPRPGALAVAATGSLLYTGLVLARLWFPGLAVAQAAETATALDVLSIFLNTGTLLVVALVASGLAERTRTAGEELEIHRRDLRELRAFQEVVLRSVGAGLVVLDRHHTITALNRAAEDLTGRSAAELAGRPWADLLPEIPLTSVEASLAQRPQASPQHEATLGRPDGRRVPVRVTFSALRSSEGAPLGLVVVLDDLSTLRELEERMRRADRLATVGRLAANLAHEIRNPLASLTGAIEALTSGLVVGDERERLGRIVLRESDRLNEMIKAFLEYARPAPLRLEPADVAAVLDDVLTLLEHRELPPSLKIVRDYPPSLPWCVDAHRLRQAVWNLCLNAVQAMPDGGELVVSAAADAGGLHIAVSDTGEGIAPEDLPHVFEPFYSTRPGGSGLGLALVHRVVQDHGGEVEVRSAPGRSTTVRLSLPAPAGAPVEAARG
jgi:two-component system sensor histidine kinase PilS (NtrC family)